MISLLFIRVTVISSLFIRVTVISSLFIRVTVISLLYKELSMVSMLTMSCDWKCYITTIGRIIYFVVNINNIPHTL